MGNGWQKHSVVFLGRNKMQTGTPEKRKREKHERKKRKGLGFMS